MYMRTRSFLETALAVKNDTSKAKTPEQLKFLEDTIHEELLGLRKRNRAKEAADDGWRWIYTDYDASIGKLVIDRVLSDEEWDELREHTWVNWYNPYDDGRDCTGIWFTAWMRRFTVAGKTIIYHRMACDV